MKTEEIVTIIETVNGGITDVSGVFVSSNAGWDEQVPVHHLQQQRHPLRY